jgi:putative membrane protein
MHVRLIAALVAAASLSARALPHVHGTRAQITDAQILGTLGAADANELEAAKLASTKSTNAAARAYAALLVRDHTRSQQTGLALAKRLRITILMPPDTMMDVTHKQEMDQLNALSPDAFDKAFVQSMVTDHQAMIAKVAKTLLPGVRNAEIRAFIRRLQPTLKMHELKGQEWLDSHK